MSYTDSRAEQTYSDNEPVYSGHEPKYSGHELAYSNREPIYSDLAPTYSNMAPTYSNIRPTHSNTAHTHSNMAPTHSGVTPSYPPLVHTNSDIAPEFSNRGSSCEDERCADRGDPVWYCVDCATFFCEDCWKKQTQHKQGKVGRDGMAHERTNFEVFQVYQKILHPSNHQETLRQMHEEDTETLWFGVTKNEKGNTRFEDHARYAALMAESPSFTSTKRSKFPRLVSFVGVTNAGKSTIIKMLIDRPHDKGKAPAHDIPYPSPVVGSAVNDKVPTSGDVHLYADPSTFTTEHPVLFADCEGMEGGETPPVGSQTRKRSGSGSRRSRMKHLPRNSRERDIAWATDETTRKREYAVTELYPRLLYTFSDVVVFVLRNPKVFQSAVLKKLLEWGAASLETSLNQPTLPHAVIVLNATEMGVDEDEWDPHIATERLLDTVRFGLDRVSGVPELRALADQWYYDRNIKIRSVRELILRYYSSFTVVRIPTRGRYNLMDQQARRLNNVIMHSCDESHRSKRRARMATTADDLNIYLQAAFDHFTNGLDRPFNFIEIALKNNPLPETFADHILQLALAIQENYKNQQRTTPKWIFEHVGRIVASCIMLDVVRYRKGAPEDLFDSYVDFLEGAYEDFFDTYWPCTFSNRRGQKCAVVRIRHHAKDHQNEAGKIIGPGGYESTFSSDDELEQWIQTVRREVTSLSEELRKREDQGRNLPHPDYHALEIHRMNLSYVFHSLDRSRINRLISHSTCFCCLKENPEHSLPCGHILCTTCIKAYSRTQSECLVLMDYCPLHSSKRDDLFIEPWRIMFKPEFAGVRVLSLDGGGVRGIVELEVLYAIELAIGCSLPIQAFFDLIVGTSTGGIVSLAVGVKQWSLQTCIHKFLELCHEAFTEREFAGWVGFEQLATLSHGSKYKTKPLRKALRKTFGDAKLFGGLREQNPDYPIRVAVTGTSGTGRDALVIANYSRNQDKTEQYEFIRSGNPDHELHVHEAAAATSAAPGYFKNFYSERNNKTFLDGALYHNNPVLVANSERKLLWPDVAACPPDLLLSIGTGTCADIGRELKDHSGNSDKDFNVKMTRIRNDLDATSKGTDQRSKTTLFKTFKALYTRFDNILDAELTWKGFKSALSPGPWSQVNAGPFPYMRVNPDLGRNPPPLDAKHEINSIRDAVIQKLLAPPLKTEVQRIAHQLIASTFFFVKTKTPAGLQHENVFTGAIHCRFEKSSQDLRRLGEFLRLQANTDFTPCFAVQESGGHGSLQDTRGAGPIQEFPIESRIIDTMIQRAAFEMEPANIEIELSHPTASVDFTLALRDNTTQRTIKYSISGFPRSFDAEERRKETQHAASTGIMKHKTTLRRKSKRHNLRTGTQASPISEKLEPVALHNSSGSDEELAKGIAASLGQTPSHDLSPQTTHESSTSGHLSLQTTHGTTASSPLQHNLSYVPSGSRAGLGEKAVPRTEDNEEQFQRELQEAIWRSRADYAPPLRRTPTTEMEEFQIAMQRSKMHDR